MSFCLIIIYTLIIAGDVELNPGPGETPVTSCGRPRANHDKCKKNQMVLKTLQTICTKNKSFL
jgi:hypothetical protein